MASIKKRTKKLNVANKGRLTADELNAYAKAYGKPIGVKDKFTYIVIPALVLCGMSFALFYNFWIPLAFGAYGAFYGWRHLMPEIVRVRYDRARFEEVNTWCNLTSMLLTSPTETLPSTLDLTIGLVEGEFKQDLKQFNSMLFGADETRAPAAFDVLSEKYKDDIIFSLYVEQLQTSYTEGKTNVDSLKDITTQHNDHREMLHSFLNEKQKHFNGMKVIIGLLFAIILLLAFSGLGLETFIRVYSRNAYVGIPSAFAFMAIFIRQMKKYMKNNFDENILEIDL